MAESRSCQRCADAIPAARLNALPDTFLCVKCSNEIGGDYETLAVPENLAKSGSLKKNYGSWTLKKKRRHISPKKRDEGES